jgi:hypothetical protein
MLVVTAPKDHDDGKAPQVNHYVTDSGYTEPKEARTYVGHNDPAPQSLLLLDLREHQSYPLKTDDLPGIKDDPLKALRSQTVAALEKAGKSDEAKALKAPDVRRVTRGRQPKMAVAAASPGATTAAILPCSCARSTTRIAGSPASISTARAGQPAAADRQGLDQLELQRFRLAQGQPHAVVSERAHRLFAALQQVARRQGTALTVRQVRGQPSAAQRRRPVVLRAHQPGRAVQLRRLSLPATGGALTRITQYQGMDDFNCRRMAAARRAAFVALCFPAAGGAADPLAATS